MLEFRKQVMSAIKQATGKEVSLESLTRPPKAGMGDLASSIAFQLSGNPAEKAKEVAEQIKPSGLISSVKAFGPYVNFFADRPVYAEKVLADAAEEDYGSSEIGKGKTVIVDFSSPNIGKPFSVGHLRSTIIGQTIINLHKYSGYKTVGWNFVGDFGTQYGKLLTAYHKWGSADTLKAEPIKEALRLYVKFHEEAEKNPELEDEGREWFKKLEQKDPEAREIWKFMREESLKKFNEIYDMLGGVHFDEWKGEAFYADNKITYKVIDMCKAKNVTTTEDDGAVVVNLEEYGMPNYLIQKKDGATLYSTRDIAQIIYRFTNYSSLDKNIYVVGSEQQLHFKQLFKVAGLLDPEYEAKSIHVQFGLVVLPEGKMSTRKGRVVFLEDVLNEAVDRAKKIVKEKNPDMAEAQVDEIAHIVGIGAVKFADLSQNKIKNITFDWDKMISFDGDTAPYLQYAHARCNQILTKAGKQPIPDFTALTEEEEFTVIRRLSEFPELLQKVTDTYETHHLANYLLDLAKDFSKFYDKHSVIKADTNGLKGARMAIVLATKNVLNLGLKLLSIDAPERM